MAGGAGQHVAGVGGHAAFDARHGSPPQIGHISQNELGIALLQGRGAARLALHLLGLADQPMAFVAVVHLDLAAGGTAEALLRTALGLELGHVNIRVEGAPYTGAHRLKQAEWKGEGAPANTNQLSR